MLLNDIIPRLQGKSAKLFFVSEGGGEDAHTFDELFNDVEALRQALSRSGIEPGMRIGLLAQSSYRWIVWDLAIMSAACISVAVTHESLTGTIEELSNRLQLSFLATDDKRLTADSKNLQYVVGLGVSDLCMKKAVRRFPAIKDDPRTHSLAFSSGTTGRVKGLIISRPGTEHLLNLYEAAFGVDGGDRFLTFLPFANYQQRMAYYFCLYHATDFVYVPYQRLFPGLKRFRPSYVIAPPVFYEATHAMTLAGVSTTLEADTRREQLTTRLRDLLGGNVRYLITGMAPIKRRTLDFFWEHSTPLYEAFGITEAGMVCWNKPGHVRIGSVGRPAEEGSVSLSPEGEVIVTRGALLSLGYFDSSPEDARATFVGPNSVATGDIAVRSDDGFVTIVGRKKDAIVTKAGEKFHPEPIETQIHGEVGVRAVVVLGGDPLPAVTAIVVVPDKENVDAIDRIRSRIAEINGSLPQCQRVRQIVFTEQDFTVENGMRTRNLKLNRRAIQQSLLGERVAAGGEQNG